MATKYWLGIADAVAQIDTVQISAFDAATTYKLTVGSLVISALGITDVNATADALRDAWNNSTHPYTTGITATTTTDTITLTADNAGVPSTVVSSVTGGTGTIGAVTNSTASAGPCHWDTAENWSDGAVPGTGDTVVFRDSSINVCYGLDTGALAIVDLRIEASYTGKIGLDRSAFATSADGETTDPTKNEYREDYLKIDADFIEIGKHVGGGAPAGSGRLKIDSEATAGVINIFSTANVAAESILTPVRLLTVGTTDIFIRAGIVGIGIDDPSEAPVMRDVFVNGNSSKLFMGRGCQFTNMVQSDGNSLVQSSITVTSVKVLGGLLTIEGDFTITDLTIEQGTVRPNQIKTAGNAITTLNANGGIVEGARTSIARTWATVNMQIGASMEIDPNQVTITTLNSPADEHTISFS